MEEHEVSGALLFSLFLVYFGSKMAWDLATRGSGGNDPTALGVVIVLFLGLGGMLLIGLLYTIREQIQDFRARRASPFLKD